MRKQHDLLNALFANLKQVKAKQAKKTGAEDKVRGIREFMRAHQRAVTDDPSPFVAVRSARQQGKSTWATLHAALRALQKPKAEWAIIGLTRASVQRIYWEPLRNLSEAFGLGVKMNEQKLIATFPNGSKIHFFGADKIDEIEKLRGSRFHGAIIDECKSFNQAQLKSLIEDILGATLKGQAGQLYLIGTPGDLLAGEFFLATSPEPVLMEKVSRWSNLPYGEATREALVRGQPEQLKGIWSFHHWGPGTNDVKFLNERTGTYFTMADAFQEEKALRGWADDHPTWRREYLGEWVPGDGRLVYRYRSHLHDYDPEPTPDNTWGLPVKGAGWRTVVGIDFGTKDGTSLVVWAWHPHIMGLWELYSEKRKPESWGDEQGLRMPVRLIAAWYKEVERDYGPFDASVGDPAGLATMVIDTLAADHGVYVEPAEKKEKADFIEMFNNDLDAGLIHFRRGSELTEEMLGNKWLEKSLGTEKRVEDPSTPNDLCDAALYAFRWCLHRAARPAAPSAPPVFSADWHRQRAREERDKIIADLIAQKREEANRLDAPWWEETN
jgi:hypothetical protein